MITENTFFLKICINLEQCSRCWGIVSSYIPTRGAAGLIIEVLHFLNHLLRAVFSLFFTLVSLALQHYIPDCARINSSLFKQIQSNIPRLRQCFPSHKHVIVGNCKQRTAVVSKKWAEKYLDNQRSPTTAVIAIAEPRLSFLGFGLSQQCSECTLLMSLKSNNECEPHRKLWKPVEE